MLEGFYLVKVFSHKKPFNTPSSMLWNNNCIIPCCTAVSHSVSQRDAEEDLCIFTRTAGLTISVPLQENQMTSCIINLSLVLRFHLLSSAPHAGLYVMLLTHYWLLTLIQSRETPPPANLFKVKTQRETEVSTKACRVFYFLHERLC